MARIHTLFDCKHETDLDVSIENDVEIPSTVRGLGKCPLCVGETHLVPVSGVAPQPGGRIVVDSIMLIPIEG
ncbi:MAG: hypothetical protein NVS2B16_04040 [Chloroflexota bacterium]